MDGNCDRRRVDSATRGFHRAAAWMARSVFHLRISGRLLECSLVLVVPRHSRREAWRAGDGARENRAADRAVLSSPAVGATGAQWKFPSPACHVSHLLLGSLLLPFLASHVPAGWPSSDREPDGDRGGAAILRGLRGCGNGWISQRPPG